MKQVYTLFILLFSSLSIAQTLPKMISEDDFSIGKRIEIKSTVLGENRILNIYLPNSYSGDSIFNYPVIYLFDGSKHEDFIHIAGLVQFGSYPWINMVPESIVVGIENVDRIKDFTYPTNDKSVLEEAPTSGGSAKFMEYIEKEVQPFVNTKFRVTKDKTLIGQSLGGLLATEILFKKPDLFDNYIIVSPSLWWDDESLLKYELKPFASPKKIYVGVGGKEHPIMQRVAFQLYEKLINLEQEDITLNVDRLTEKNHADPLHEAVYHAFEAFSKKEGDE